MTDDDMTSEEFDRRLNAAQPVELRVLRYDVPPGCHLDVGDQYLYTTSGRVPKNR